MKRLMAMMLACMMMMGTSTISVFAASNETTKEDTVTVSESKANTESETEAKESEAETEAMTEEEVSEKVDVKKNKDGSITFSYGDWEWTSGDEKAVEKIGTVTDVSSYLHLRNGAGMDYDIIGHLLPGAQVKVIGEDGDWYQVTVPEQTGYVHSDYLTVLENASSTDDVDEDMLATLLYMMMVSAEQNGVSLTPDGNMTLVDDIGSSTSEGQQFLTFVTKSGNTFYMIIDRNDKGEENVHFLNLVDEADLFALMDEDAAAQIKTPTVTEEPTVTETTETEEPEKVETPETEKKKSPMMALLLLFLAGVGGVGGFLYVKMKGKKSLPKQDTPDPDADYQDEDEDAYDLPEDEDEDDSDEYDEDAEGYTEDEEE